VEDIANWTFVQDGAPAHKAEQTQKYLETHVPQYIVKEIWPASSPDLNYIENIWSIVDEKVYADPIPKTVTELECRVTRAWESISKETIQKLARSMPRRIFMCLEREGNKIPY
jgi:hypothetical protein